LTSTKWCQPSQSTSCILEVISQRWKPITPRLCITSLRNGHFILTGSHITNVVWFSALYHQFFTLKEIYFLLMNCRRFVIVGTFLFCTYRSCIVSPSNIIRNYSPSWGIQVALCFVLLFSPSLLIFYSAVPHSCLCDCSFQWFSWGSNKFFCLLSFSHYNVIISLPSVWAVPLDGPWYETHYYYYKFPTQYQTHISRQQSSWLLRRISISMWPGFAEAIPRWQDSIGFCNVVGPLLWTCYNL